MSAKAGSSKDLIGSVRWILFPGATHDSQVGYGCWQETPVLHIGLFRSLLLDCSHDMAVSFCHR